MHVHCQVWDQVLIDSHTDTEKAPLGSLCGKDAIIPLHFAFSLANICFHIQFACTTHPVLLHLL